MSGRALQEGFVEFGGERSGINVSGFCLERGYSLKILCVRSHVSDREFIQFTAEAWSLKILTGSRVPSGHSASTSH